MSSTLAVMIRNSLKNGPLVVASKLLKRFERRHRDAATAWAREQAVEIETWSRDRDGVLWAETETIRDRIQAESGAILRSLPVPLGGAAAFPLLYFVARRYRPQVMVETGVAAGWSSRGLLEAGKANGGGRLYSSDFPYLRIPDPERYIGCLVPEDLRTSWHLDIRGDRYALPALTTTLDRIDLFHYDSDKSASGRRFALEVVTSMLAEDAVVIMDDINDNLFFKNWTESIGVRPRMFHYCGKYIGALGLD